MHYRSTYIKSHSIDTFMADRPPAADLLRQHPDLEHWLRTEWSRPIAGSHLVWDNRKPIISPESEYAPAPPPWRVIGIRVSKNVSPVDQLLDLSFETCNAHGSPRIAALQKQAAAKKITRQDFVDGIEATEYDAVLHMKDSFPKLFILSTNEMDRFADPADATDQWFVPFFEINPRSRCSIPAKSSQPVLKIGGQLQGFSGTSNDPPNQQNGLKNSRERALVGGQHRAMVTNQVRGNFGLHIRKGDNEIGLNCQ